MKNHTWLVWTETSSNPFDLIDGRNILFAGCKAKCLNYYKKHGGCAAGLHLGYDL
jgi:hypothetical protein